jgi:hypothetical protein
MNQENKIEIPSMEVEPKPEKRKPGRPRKVQAAPEVAISGDVGMVDVRMTVPLHEGDLGYCSRHVDTQLTAKQARAMKRMLIGLQRRGITIGERREPVKSGADVVRYLLDQIPEP